MIEAYVGLIGGGKTFSALGKISEYLASGGLVVTNVDLMLEPWYNYRYEDKLKAFETEKNENTKQEGGKSWANAIGLRRFLKSRWKWELHEDQIIELTNEQISGKLHEHLPAGTVEKPVLVVIDEAVDFFDMEDRKDANREFLTFLRYSRKLNIDLIMIAQEYSELNKRIRNQVQWVWTFKDLGVERVPVLRCPYPPPYRYNIIGTQWSGRSFPRAVEPVAIKMRWKDKGIFACYRTEELFREVKVLKGVKTNFTQKTVEGVKKMSKLDRVIMLVMLGILVFVVVKISVEKPRQVLQNSSVPVEGVTTKSCDNLSSNSYRYGIFRTESRNGKIKRIQVKDQSFRLGQVCKAGVVVSMSDDEIHFVNQNGSHGYYYNISEKFAGKLNIPSENTNTVKKIKKKDLEKKVEKNSLTVGAGEEKAVTPAVSHQSRGSFSRPEPPKPPRRKKPNFTVNGHRQ